MDISVELTLTPLKDDYESVIKDFIKSLRKYFKNNNEVFVFNGWMFSSSPSITPFDHPVYDVWLKRCY